MLKLNHLLTNEQIKEANYKSIIGIEEIIKTYAHSNFENLTENDLTMISNYMFSGQKLSKEQTISETQFRGLLPKINWDKRKDYTSNLLILTNIKCHPLANEIETILNEKKNTDLPIYVKEINCGNPPKNKSGQNLRPEPSQIFFVYVQTKKEKENPYSVFLKETSLKKTILGEKMLKTEINNVFSIGRPDYEEYSIDKDLLKEFNKITVSTFKSLLNFYMNPTNDNVNTLYQNIANCIDINKFFTNYLKTNQLDLPLFFGVDGKLIKSNLKKKSKDDVNINFSTDYS